MNTYYEVRRIVGCYCFWVDNDVEVAAAGVDACVCARGEIDQPIHYKEDGEGPFVGGSPSQHGTTELTRDENGICCCSSWGLPISPRGICARTTA